MREIFVTDDHVQVVIDGVLVGEGGVCTDPECRCAGTWAHWGEQATPAEISEAQSVESDAIEDGYLYRRSYDQSDMTMEITRSVVDDDSEPQNGILPETVGDDEEMLPEALGEMIRVVCRHGDAYTGGVARDAAQGWIDAGFSASDADEWMDAGWWDCDRAASARDIGLTPDQTIERSQALIDACGDNIEDAAHHYTDGDPIYSICNGDTSLDVLATEVACA